MNLIKAIKDDDIREFHSQAEIAREFEVTKQAVSKSLKNGTLCNGYRLEVVRESTKFYSKEWQNNKNNLVMNGKVVGTFKHSFIRNGNLIIEGAEVD